MNWVWAGGHGEVMNGSDFSSEGVLNGGELSVVFGSSISPTGLKVGESYDDLVRVVTWDNSERPSSIELSETEPLGFELIPFIEHYPKLPILYSAVILIAAIGFVVMEARKVHELR